MPEKFMITHVSKLAKLELAEKEKIQMQEEFNNILHYVDVLKEVDTADTLPTSHCATASNVFRKDEVKPSQPVAEVLANAADKTETYFCVPRAVEE